MDRVTRVSGPQGRGFDSLQAHQILNINGGSWEVGLNMLMVRDHNGITISWARSTWHLTSADGTRRHGP